MGLVRSWLRQCARAGGAALVAPVALIAAIAIAASGGGIGGLGSLRQLLGGPTIPRSSDPVATVRLLEASTTIPDETTSAAAPGSPARVQRASERKQIRRERRRERRRQGGERPAQPGTPPATQPPSTPPQEPPPPPRTPLRQVGDTAKQVTDRLPAPVGPAASGVIDDLVDTADCLLGPNPAACAS